MTYHNTKSDLYQMFIDGTANETGNQNRLSTQGTERGTVELLAYGWQKIAEYHPESNAVFVFLGHKGSTPTTTKYLNEIDTFARENDRRVIESGESPYDGQPPECINYANEYIDWNSSLSKVERKAQRHVQTVLKGLY